MGNEVAVQVEIFRGDTPLLQFQLTKPNGAPFDLTDYTAYFAATSYGATLLFDLTCTITDAANGLCEVQLDATHTGTAGYYTGEIECRKTVDQTTYIHTANPHIALVIKDDVRKGT